MLPTATAAPNRFQSHLHLGLRTLQLLLQLAREALLGSMQLRVLLSHCSGHSRLQKAGDAKTG